MNTIRQVAGIAAVLVWGVLLAIYALHRFSLLTPLPTSFPSPDAYERLKSLGVNVGKGDIAFSVMVPRDPLPKESIAVLSSMKNLTGLRASPQVFSDHLSSEIANLTELESISFEEVAITPDEMEVLYSQLSKLRVVGFVRMKLNNEHLQRMGTIRLLRSLNIRESNFQGCDLAPLQALSSLETLSLYHSRITGQQLQFLSENRSVTHLDLSRTLFDDQGLEILGTMKKLRSLALHGTCISDSGLRHLRGHPTLESLDLGLTDITDKGIRELADLPSLRHLSLDGKGITNASLKILERVPSLIELQILRTSVTDEGCRTLQMARPQLKIVRQILI